ncbi:MAG: Uma2 family endonuclease [Anaerolineae bacterium]|nr:Uma2 family endonuclease [Anaerolineae bacterium]
MAAVQIEDVLTQPQVEPTPAGPPTAHEGPSWSISPALRRQILEALERPPKMTYEEFLAWADEDTLAEWVDGEVIMTSPAGRKHQTIVGFLHAVLSMYVQLRELGVVLASPFQMKLTHGREPDLLFLARDHLERLKPNYLDGPADLVVEVLSTESRGRDRGEKFYEYAQGGVPEYWLIDPDAQWVEGYRLSERHLYEPFFIGREGVIRSAAVPGFWLRAEWLWASPLPNPLRVLGEIAGLPAETVDGFLRALQGAGSQ